MKVSKHFLAVLFWAGPVLFGQAGSPEGTSLLGVPLVSEPDTSGKIHKADADLKAAPQNPELILAAGRARDSLSQFNGSIKVYTQGVTYHPGDVRFWRLRGHRYISLRRFSEAVRDLEKARSLAPSSFEAAYYLGMALYFKGEFNEAANEFARCVNMAGKPDENAKTLPKGMPSCANLHQSSNFLVAMADWHFRALRRASNRPEAREEAKQLLNNIRDGMQVQDNLGNYRALLFYKGKMNEKQALEGLTGISYSTAASGIALAQMTDGKSAAACGLWKKVANEKPWAAFGVIASEVELARTSSGACALFK